MPEIRQITRAEASMLEVAGGIGDLRSSLEAQARANSDAADMERQAKQMRRSAASSTEEAWYSARQGLTDPGEEIDDTHLLHAALAFAAITPPKSVLPQALRHPGRSGRYKGGRVLTGNPFRLTEQPVHPDAVVGLFDSLQAGKPIVFPENQGLLTGHPKVLVREKLAGISIQFAMGMHPVDVTQRLLGEHQVNIKVGVESIQSVAIGIPEINHYVAGLETRQLPDTCGHGRYRSNLATLESELDRISALAEALGLTLDLSGLEAQVQNGRAKEQAHQRMARHRPYGGTLLS